ncbi:MAG: FGGY family carbohydrate kinase, partial [Candidatus Dormibacteria bacterium]
MPAPLILAVDQGTSGTTAVLVDTSGRVVRRAYAAVGVEYPHEGWVQQDADELWRSVQQACASVLDGVDVAPAAMGITNQRETLVVFDRATLEPVAPAIVWQCRRSTELCEEHRARGEEVEVRRRTGLLLDPYFTATKIEWVLQRDESLRARADRGELCATTVDGWLVAQLTGGSVVATDVSNASRTLLVDLRRGGYDDDLCALFSVPHAALPEIHDSAGRVAVTDPSTLCGVRAPIAGIAGDQQAALFGQACLRPGMSKNTYGTGSFVLTNVG